MVSRERRLRVCYTVMMDGRRCIDGVMHDGQNRRLCLDNGHDEDAQEQQP
jgi:hypothetical protein